MSSADLGEAWSLSKVTYAEVVYRPAIRAGYYGRNYDPARLVKVILRSAALNKLIFAVFNLGGAVFPFLLLRLGVEQTTLAVSVALSLILVFGYTVLYAVQVLPSFVTSGSFAPLAAMPVEANDTAIVAALTLWRTMDAIVVLTLLAQFAAVAALTGSVVAAIVVLASAILTEVLAVALALVLVSFFQRRFEGGSLTGLRSTLRPLAFVLWGLAVMSAVFLFSLASFVAPALAELMSATSGSHGLALALLLPFSAGDLVSILQGQPTTALAPLFATAGMVVGAATAFASYTGVRRMMSGVVVRADTVVQSHARTSLTFLVRGPLAAYVRKDLRVASRSPSTGFLFALPIFELVSVVVPLTATALVRMSAILVGASVAGGFALFTAFLLVTVEDMGVERSTVLPILQRTRTISKSIVPSATYLPVPFVLAAILFTKHLTFGPGWLVPFLATMSVFGGCIVEVLVLRRLTERNRGAAIRFAVGVGSGLAALLLPGIAYTFAYAATASHSAALAAFSVVSAGEGVAGLLLVSKER